MTCLIGGVPLFRVHELEYQSGEVRLNVDYESAHKYLFSTPSEKYLNVLQNGEIQLEILRNNSDQILNVREQQYQEELRIENERREREERTKKEKDLLDVQRRAEISSQQETLDPNAVGIAGLTVAGAIGAFAFFGTGPEKSKTDEESTQVTLAAFDEVKNTTLLEMNITKPVSIPIPPIQEKTAQNEPYKSWDPDRDDGGEAWLGALNEIMNEDEGEMTPTMDRSP